MTHINITNNKDKTMNTLERLTEEYKSLIDQVEEQKLVIKELLEEVKELRALQSEPVHTTKDGERILIKDMTNIHILRYLRIKFERGFLEGKEPYLAELINRNFDSYGVITERDARELGFCSKGITWAKLKFSNDNEVKPSRFLHWLNSLEENHHYASKVVDTLIHYVYKVCLAKGVHPYEN